MGLDTTVRGVASLTGTFLFLTTVVIILRFVARYRQKARISADDYLAVAAWVGYVGLASLAFMGMQQKFIGYPEPKSKDVVNGQHALMEQVFLAIDVLGGFTFGTAKLSALFFYRRIFCTTGARDLFHYATLIFIFVAFGWTVTFIVMPLRDCGNRSFTWIEAPGHSALCKLIYPYFEATTISDLILDVLIILLPLPKIWSLNTTRGRKIAISGVFLLALVGIGASCARMVVYVNFVRTGRTLNDEDGYQSNTQAGYYAFLEAGLSVVSINMPSLWYFAAGVTPERVLRSVRSIISLGSRPSQGSHGASKTSVNRTGRDLEGGRSMETNSSRSNLTKNGVESYAMADIEPIPPVPHSENSIGVERTFVRTEEHA